MVHNDLVLGPVNTPVRCRDTMMAVPSSRTPLVAMVGGGQLARMTHQAAIALGQTRAVRVRLECTENNL